MYKIKEKFCEKLFKFKSEKLFKKVHSSIKASKLLNLNIKEFVLLVFSNFSCNFVIINVHSSSEERVASSNNFESSTLKPISCSAICNRFCKSSCDGSELEKRFRTEIFFSSMSWMETIIFILASFNFSNFICKPPYFL